MCGDRHGLPLLVWVEAARSVECHTLPADQG